MTPFLRTFSLVLYSLALRLYPSTFRKRYADEMRQAASAELKQTHQFFRTCTSLFYDLLQSLMREHWRAASPSNPAHVGGFAIFFTILLLSIYLFAQQRQHRFAYFRDQQSQHLVELVATHSTHGTASVIFEDLPQSLPVWGKPHNLQQGYATFKPNGNASIRFRGDKQNLSSASWMYSSSIFVATYDPAGKAIASNAILDGALPQPTPDVFTAIRSQGGFKALWVPHPDISIELKGTLLADGGFVLVGQNAMTSDANLAHFLLYLWLAMAVACTLPFAHAYRKRIP